MRIRSNFSRYDVQEGFEDHPPNSQAVLQFKKEIIQSYSVPLNRQIKKNRSPLTRQETKLSNLSKIVVGYISIEKDNSNSTHYAYLKQEQEKQANKSMTLDKQQTTYFNIKKRNNPLRLHNKPISIQNFKNSLIKPKRSQIGENVQLKQYNVDEVKHIKELLISKGATIVFQEQRQKNSHGLFKKYLKSKQANNFLKSKYNSSLFQKLSESYIHPKTQISTKLQHFQSKKSLQFVSDFQTSNLDFVTQINPFQYDLYIKADTNTLGHQNWFYFKLFNRSQQKKTIFLNVCNLKRGFKMIKKGQKIYQRSRKIFSAQIKTSIQNQDEEWSEWEKIQEQLTVSINQQNLRKQGSGKRKKLYKLSFSYCLLASIQYEFSLIPPFTYSQMLKDIEMIQKTCEHAEIQILTFSLLGLAIPMVTFTKKNISNKNKSVILINSRIHPGQTCGSFVAKGIMNKLAESNQQNDQFLSNYIVKIIPMINPDGVILGNFRTNYLGNDLNRSFHQDNQATFPEIVGLKQLGKRLKQEFKQRFLCFLDLHGHSSQKNIFIYGPNYDQTNKNYISSRFLPKTLSYLSEQFDYGKCSFALEQYKVNTARGYFFSLLKVMSFTIQSSYALYDSTKNQSLKNLDLKIINWLNFGSNVVNSIFVWAQSLKAKKREQRSPIQGEKQVRLPQEQTQQQDTNVVNKIRKQIKKDSLIKRKYLKKRKQSESSLSSESQDSDGQSQSQDISIKDREKLERKFIQGNIANIFPRILRPAIIHPEVTPPVPLFSVSKIGPIGGKHNPINGSIINGRIKKNRYQNIKPVNVNNAYTQYLLKEVKGLQSLRPSVNLKKLQRKQSMIHSSHISVK